MRSVIDAKAFAEKSLAPTITLRDLSAQHGGSSRSSFACGPLLRLLPTLPERAIACRAYPQSCLPYVQQIVAPVPAKQRSLHAQCARFVIEAQGIDRVFRLFKLPQPGTWRTSEVELCGFVLKLAPQTLPA